MNRRVRPRFDFAIRGLLPALACLFSVTPNSSFGQPMPWPGDYRHVHKPQLKAIVDGDFDQAIVEADKILETHPQDAESLFFKAIATANRSTDLATILRAMRAATEAGVPIERFLIGTAPWTDPFRDHEPFAMVRENVGVVLAGPMLGNVTDTTAQIWLRTIKNIRVRVRFREWDASDGDYQCTNSVAPEGNDLTAVLKLSGLTPNTEYAYHIESSAVDETKWQEGKSGTFTFRSAPAWNQPTRFTVAFGGGAAYLPHKEQMWTTIGQHDPDLLLLLGDNVYIDDPTNETYQRYLYYRRQCQVQFRELVGSTAVYSIWDDHDFGDNDCHGGPLIESPPWKIPVWKVFQQNWVNPGYGGGAEAPGCWYEFSRGDVQFILLDGRYYRDPKPADGTAPTMLGNAQKRWLKETLLRSNARIKVLCSPVPFAGGNPDKWTGYKEERDEIFSFIESNSISGVLLLSADRHRSDLLVHRRKNGNRYFEFMSSKLTNHHTHRVANEKDGAIYSYNSRCSFGLVEFDTTLQAPTVDYRIINIDNEQVFRFRLELSNGG